MVKQNILNQLHEKGLFVEEIEVTGDYWTDEGLYFYVTDSLDSPIGWHSNVSDLEQYL